MLSLIIQLLPPPSLSLALSLPLSPPLSLPPPLSLTTSLSPSPSLPLPPPLPSSLSPPRSVSLSLYLSLKAIYGAALAGATTETFFPNSTLLGYDSTLYSYNGQ